MRSAGCALIPTNEAALPPVEACWEEGREGEGSDGDEELEVCSPAPHCAPPYTPSTPSPRSPSSISLHSHVALPPLTLHLPLCPWPYLRPLTRAALARPFTAVREEALLDPGRAPRSEE